MWRYTAPEARDRASHDSPAGLMYSSRASGTAEYLSSLTNPIRLSITAPETKTATFHQNERHNASAEQRESLRPANISGSLGVIARTLNDPLRERANRI